MTNILKSEIPWDIITMTEVKQLSLDNLSLSMDDILHVIRKKVTLEKITMLHLQRNNLRSVTSDLLTGFVHLDDLNLASNRISRIEKDCFRHLPSLAVLDLSNNDLGLLLSKEHVFTHMENVGTLNLRNCSIRSLLWNTFKDMPSLASLNLDGNQLTTVPVEQLLPCQSLNYLSLRYNHIKYIDEKLSRLNRLQLLFLDSNGLEDIHSRALDGFTELTQLSLTNNRLTTLHIGLQPAISRIQTLEQFKIVNVTWHCDCRLLWLVRLIQHGPSNSLQTPKCFWPPRLADTPLRHVTADDLRCPVNPACESGHFVAIPCQWCPPYQKSLGGGECQCMEGYENSTDNYSHCRACAMGFFKDKVGRGACVECPSGKTTLTEGASFCVCNDTSMAVSSCGKADQVHKGTSHRQFSPTTLHGDMNDAKRELTTSKPPIAQSGVMVAVGVGVVVVVIVALIMGLSLICAKRGSCHKRRDFFVDSTEISHHVLGVIIDHDITTLAPNDLKLHIRRVRVGRLLGRGAFGQVHEGVIFCTQNNVKRNIPVAVKRVKDRAFEEEGKALQEELEQMILVGSHPNIISLLGSCVHDGNLHIIMELAEEGDLLTYLRNRKLWHEQYVSVGKDGTLSMQQSPQITDNAELMMFAWHIARGMCHLEELKCIHRDLAARNCLIAAGPVAKLSDFGLSRDVYENGYYFRRSKGRVPYKWLSPEAMLWGQYSSKSDVWSYGVLLWEIATLGGTPYSGIPPDRIGEMHRARYRLPQPPRCPDNFYKVIRRCWHEDPRKRPTFRQLCDVIDHFVQAAADRKYLDLQPQEEKLCSEDGPSADDSNDKATPNPSRHKGPIRLESVTSDYSQTTTTGTECKEPDSELEPMLRELCSQWSDSSSVQSQWSEDDLTIRQTQGLNQNNYTSGYCSSQSLAAS